MPTQDEPLMMYFLISQSLWLKASSKWRNVDAIYCTEVYVPHTSSFCSLWGSELFLGWFTSRKVSVNFSACEQHSFGQMYFFISSSISDLSAALLLIPETWRKLKKLWWKLQIPSILKSTLAILSPAFTRQAATWWMCGVYWRILKALFLSQRKLNGDHCFQMRKCTSQLSNAYNVSE